MRPPNDWRICRIQEVAVVNPEQLGSDTPPRFTFRYLDISSVTEGSIDWSTVTEHQFQTAPSRARRVVRNGDVLLCTVRPGLQSHAYAAWPDSTNTISSTGFAVIRCGEQVDSRYLGKLIFHDLIACQLRALEVGSSYPAVNEADVRQLRLWLPPINEQQRIADILDAADAAIRQTAALVAKLWQAKAGLLHDLLTCGLDKRGRLRDPVSHPKQFKDSPLGRIPTEWDVASVEDVGEVRLGRQRSPLHHSGKYTTPYLRVANVFDGRIDYNDVLEMDFTPGERLVYELRAGDILLNEGQSLELVGRSAIYDGIRPNLCFQNTLVRFRCRGANVPDYCRAVFKYWLDTGRFMQIAKQTTSVAHLGADRFAKMLFPRPSVAEQSQIAERLDMADLRIRTEEASLAKLKLQKRGLMNDLLTGRVRV